MADRQHILNYRNASDDVYVYEDDPRPPEPPPLMPDWLVRLWRTYAYAAGVFLLIVVVVLIVSYIIGVNIFSSVFTGSAVVNPPLPPIGTVPPPLRSSVIAFVRDHEGAPAVYVLAQPHGVAQRVATNGLPAHSPAWQPDCAALLVVVMVNEEHQVIYRAYLDGREPTKLSNVHPGLIEHSPVFSPRGDRIAYISNANRQQRFNLHRMRSDGTMVEQLTAYEHENVVAFRWLDERRLELILATPTHWERLEFDLLTHSEHVSYRSNLPLALEEDQTAGTWPQVPQGSTQVRSCWP